MVKVLKSLAEYSELFDKRPVRTYNKKVNETR